jgi:hypothetical protein
MNALSFALSSSLRVKKHIDDTSHDKEQAVCDAFRLKQRGKQSKMIPSVKLYFATSPQEAQNNALVVAKVLQCAKQSDISKNCIKWSSNFVTDNTKKSSFGLVRDICSQ